MNDNSSLYLLLAAAVAVVLVFLWKKGNKAGDTTGTPDIPVTGDDRLPVQGPVTRGEAPPVPSSPVAINPFTGLQPPPPVLRNTTSIGGLPPIAPALVPTTYVGGFVAPLPVLRTVPSGPVGTSPIVAFLPPPPVLRTTSNLGVLPTISTSALSAFAPSAPLLRTAAFAPPPTLARGLTPTVRVGSF